LEPEVDALLVWKTHSFLLGLVGAVEATLFDSLEEAFIECIGRVLLGLAGALSLF
jgi:hypothetical protein